MDINAERYAFEQAAYEEYVTNETTARIERNHQESLKGKPDLPFGPLMRFEQFIQKHDNGKYQLIGVDAAWWGWKTRAERS